MSLSDTTLIVEPNTAFMHYLVQGITDRYDIDPIYVKDVSEAAAPNLLRLPRVYILHTKSKKELALAYETLEALTGKDGLWLKLIITTGLPSNQTRALVKDFSSLGVETFTPTASKNRTVKELENAGLSRTAVTLAAGYAGDEFERIIPLLRYTRTLNKREVQKLTVEDIAPYLAGEVGKKAPWGILDHIIDQDYLNINDTIRRATGGESFTVSILKAKIAELRKIAALQAADRWITLDKVALAVGGNKWSVRKAYHQARTVGLGKALLMEETLADWLSDPFRERSNESLLRLCLKLSAMQ